MERPALLMLYVWIVPWRTSFDIKIKTSQRSAYMLMLNLKNIIASLVLVKLAYRIDALILAAIHADMLIYTISSSSFN